MRSTDFFWPVLASYLCVAEARAGAPYARAIEPTAPGQIGVNPVTAQPGSAYLNLQGPNTKYYQSEGSTTKWIGVNTEYLTDIVQTTTIDNVPTTTTKPAPIAVVTAAAAADGLGVGDVSVAMTPKINDVLNSIASDVAAACAGKKRAACDARIEFANRVQAEIRPGGRLDFDFDFIDLPTINAPDVAAVLQAVTGTKSKVLGALIFFYIVASETHGDSEGPPVIPPAANIPATLNSPTKTGGPSSASGCDPAAPTGDDRPVCQSEDCKGPTDGGKKERKCTEGKWKDCPCIREVDGIGQQRDEKWLDDQQKVLQFLIDNDTVEKEPWCVHGASPSSGRIPTDYCQCGNNYESIYSVVKSTTSPYNPCPYTTAPGPTITFKDPEPTKPVDPPAGPTPNCNIVDKSYAWMHRGTALDAGANFCSENKGKDLGGSNQSPEHTYEDTEKYFDGTKYTFLIKAEAGPGCDSAKLDENDCKLAVGTAVDGCTTDSNDKKYGGNAVVNCQKIYVNPLKYIPCISC